MIKSKYDPNKVYHHVPFLGTMIFCLLFLGIIFFLFGVPIVAYLKFLAGLLFFVFIPGQALYRLSRLRLRRLEAITLSSVLGITVSTLIYKLALMLQAEVIFFGWLLVTFVYFILFLLKNPPEKNDFSFKISWLGVGFTALLLLVLIVLISDNFRNGVMQVDGSVTVNMHYYDGFLRNAVVRELSHSVPPQMPFAAGFPISYHYGMDLFISMFYKYLNIGVLDLIHRLTLTIFFGLLLAAVFIFFRELTANDNAALLGTFLAVFGSGGLAYLASWIMGISQWGNLFFSFYFFNFISINSILPALVVLCTGFFCAGRYLRTRKTAWLIFSGLLLALVLEFKIFFFGPVLGALLLTGILCWMIKRDFSVLRLFAFTAVPAVLIIWSAYLTNQGGPSYQFKLQFVDWIIFSLRDLKLIFLMNSWGDLAHNFQFSLVNLALAVPIILIFFIGSFGLSFFAVPRLIKEFFAFQKISAFRMLLLLFIAGCTLYIFCIYTSLGGRPRNFTNIYVYYAAVLILCGFWSEKVISYIKRRGIVEKILLVTLVLVLSVPNSMRHIRIKVDSPQPKNFPATFLEVADWMNKNTPKDAIIINPTYLRHACYFIDRRVVLDNSSNSYLTWHLSTQELEKRGGDIDRFFTEPRLNAAVLDEYRVSYVLAYNEDGFVGIEKNHSRPLDCYSDLKTRNMAKYLKSHRLELILKNRDYVLFRVIYLPPEERGAYILKKIEGELHFDKI